MTSAAHEHAEDLIDFVAASPSSYHAAAEVGRRLSEAGFVAQDETAPFADGTAGAYVIRDGAVIAWRVPTGLGAEPRLRIIGAHTDSPTFKLKPEPDAMGAGWRQLAVEVYGGPLLNSWLDRELGLAGRVVTTDGTQHLVRTGAIMRIPQLAIHLDRGVNDGLALGKQRHTAPVWGIGPGDIMAELAVSAGVDAADIRGHDVVAYDTARGAVFGPEQEFLACSRMDNLSSVHAGMTALLAADDSDAITVLAAFDHEEIGSASRSGAAGPILADVVARIATTAGISGEEWHRMLARSMVLSADAGHAVHPNYAERHDPTHHPMLNAGVLLKINANQRYATDAVGSALWRQACADAGARTQPFVSNNDLPCGSTIGPITATRLGITTVDVGIPLLSMHSARELAGVADPLALARATKAFMTL